MVVEDCSSVISREDTSAPEPIHYSSISQLLEDEMNVSLTVPAISSSDLLFGKPFLRDMAEAIADAKLWGQELDISDDEPELTGHRHHSGKSPERLRVETSIPPSNPTSSNVWPRVDRRSPAQHEFFIASGTGPNYPNEMVIGDGDPSGPTRHVGHGHSVPTSLLREILHDSQIDPAELQLARDRDLEQNPCPSLFTGSTKDTESITGYDMGRRLEPNERIPQGMSPTDLTQPEVRVFLASEAENHRHFAHIYADQPMKDEEAVKHTEPPMTLSSYLVERTSLAAGPPPPSNTKPPTATTPETLMGAVSEKQQQESNDSPPSTALSPAGLATKRDEVDESVDETSDTDSYEGGYYSDYTPDVPYMSDDHLFMQYKDEVLRIHFQRFTDWPQPAAHKSHGQDASDARNHPQVYRQKLSESRNKRARDNVSKGSLGSGSSEQDPKAANAKNPRNGDKRGLMRLACPFYKKDPVGHNGCHRMTLSAISRVKQHLSRNHQLPVYCPVCKEIFPDEGVRDTHTMQRTYQPRTDIVCDH